MKTALDRLNESRLRKQQAEERRRARELSKKWSEKLVADHLVRCVKEAGGLIFKQHPLTNKGIPDYLVFYRWQAFFVETKTTGEKCEPAQIEFHKILKEKGIETYVLDTKITNFFDLYTYAYKTYVDPDDKRYGINKLKR